MLSILLGNLIVFTVVFSILGLTLKSMLGLSDFRTTVLFFLALGEGLGLFDLVVIDLLWWRNTKRLSSFLRGIPLFALVALLSAGLVTILR